MANMTTIPVALWGEKTALLLVLEVVLDCMFCEMRISVGQETFTKVYVNRTVVDCFLGGLSLCRVEGVYLYSCMYIFNSKSITISKQGLQKHHNK